LPSNKKNILIKKEPSKKIKELVKKELLLVKKIKEALSLQQKDLLEVSATKMAKKLP
jgi:hypothetical protein